MLEKIKTYALIIFAVLAIAASFTAYSYIKKYENSQSLNKAYAAQIVQNDSAYANILKQKDDTIQNNAVMIINLNSDVSKKDKEKGYWEALYTITKVKLDSIEQHGTGIASTGKDSTGDYAQVDFSGSKGIASYNGWTKYYITQKDVKPLWYLDIGFKQFPIYSSLYQDADKIWRVKSYVDEPGIKFTTYNNVDSSLFIAFKSEMAKPEIQAGKYNFGIGANIAQDKLAPGVLFKIGQNIVLLNYRIVDVNSNNTLKNWYDRVEVGYYYLFTR